MGTVSLRNCNDEDRRIIGEALRAAALGPFFPEWEFPTLFGLERAEVARIARSWPEVDANDPAVRLAVGGSLNNLVGYPHGCEGEWSAYLSVLPARLTETLRRWRTAPND